MTHLQFNEFIEETIPQQLFHINHNDRDDETGGRLEEVVLVKLIANNPGCLKHKSLKWFLDTYL